MVHNHTNHINFPDLFCIYYDQDYTKNPDKQDFDNFKFTETMKVIHNINRFKPSNESDTLVLNFSLCDRISAAALLLLYSSIEKFIEKYNRKVIISHLAKNKQVNKLLQRTGFIKICNQEKNEPDFSAKTIPIITGIKGEHRDEIVNFIQKGIYQNKMSELTESSFGDAIQETFSNVNRHAYPNEKDNDKKKWWLIYDLYGNQLNLAIYDNGIGIPETIININKINFWNKVWNNKESQATDDVILKEIIEFDTKDFNNLKKINEWLRIAIAMYPNASSTEKLKHGQGSKSIQDLVKQNKGKLILYSNKGLYFSAEFNSGRDLKESISGTLIQWNITVAK